MLFTFALRVCHTARNLIFPFLEEGSCLGSLSLCLPQILVSITVSLNDSKSWPQALDALIKYSSGPPMPPPHLSRGIVQGIPLGKSPAPSACGLQWLRLSAVFHLGSEHVCFQRSREHAEAVLSFPLRCVSMVIFLPSVCFPHSVLAQ